MSLDSNDPFEVLRAVRATANAPPARDRDLTSPTGSQARHLEVPEPGVVHPAHVAWVAGCLNQSTQWVERTLVEGTPETACGVRAIAQALHESRGPGRERLEHLGVEPGELVLRRLPLAPGRTRPNPKPTHGTNPLMSSENAALQMFRRQARAIAHLIKLGVPAVIVDNRVNQLQRQLRELHHLLRNHSLLFEPDEQLAKEPATSNSLVIPPTSSSWEGAPIEPLQVAVAGESAIVRFHSAIAQIDLQSGTFSTHALAEAGLVAIVDDRAVFAHDVHLIIFDMKKRKFTLHQRSIPRRVIIGACCGISILDTETRSVATMPGPLASSAFDFATSPCGQYGWLELSPACDEVGIFSLERLERVFQPWPHPQLGHVADTAEDDDEGGEGHDGTARALAHLPDGSFRLVYGKYVLQDRFAHRLSKAPRAASFDRSGTRLITVDPGALRSYSLGSNAKPTLEARWSLKRLVAQVAAPHPVGEGSLERLAAP